MKTRLSVLALAAAAFTTTMITTDSSASDKNSPVASHAGSPKQKIYTGNLDDFRRIAAHKNLTPPRFAPHGLCAECHTPSVSNAPASAH